MHRIKPQLLLLALLAHSAGVFASPKQPSAPASPSATYQFCIMEGVGKQQSQAEAEALWEPLQLTVSKAIGAKARFHLYQNFTSIERDIRDGNCDIALVKPVHYAGMAMREYGYEPVVRVEGSYVGNFVVHKDSAIKKYEDLAGKTIMLPDEKSLQSLLAKRYFKEHPLNPPPILKHTRLQETVLYAVETKTADAGWVNPTLAAQWVKGGSGFMSGAIKEGVINYLQKAGDEARLAEIRNEANQQQRVLHKSDAYPYWVVISGKRINGQGLLIRQALLKYGQDPANKAVLESMGIKKGFAEVDEKTRKFYESLI
jgi:ABC-type phosphate/phosphonate transport system substrate-binding protein